MVDVAVPGVVGSAEVEGSVGVVGSGVGEGVVGSGLGVAGVGSGVEGSGVGELSPELASPEFDDDESPVFAGGGLGVFEFGVAGRFGRVFVLADSSAWRRASASAWAAASASCAT